MNAMTSWKLRGRYNGGIPSPRRANPVLAWTANATKAIRKGMMGRMSKNAARNADCKNASGRR